MKNILLIATGGTVASRQTGNGLAPGVSGEELAALIPGIGEICHLDALQAFSLDSTNVRPGHWMKLAQLIRDNYEKYDGFVITHGTDTMAYTAAGLSYLVQNSPKPIVLTGAQKPIEAEDTDAKRNILDALTYACDDESRFVTVVFSGAVIAGTRARKNFSKRFTAFGSVNFPELARVQDGRVIRYVPEKCEGAPVFSDYLDPNVGLIKLTPGVNNEVLRFAIETYDGLIIESYGVGGLPEYSDFYPQIRDAVGRGKAIVMTTQVPNEGSDLEVYRVGNLLKNDLGVPEARDMTSEAALAKLMWILGQTDDRTRRKELFYTPVHHDILCI